MANKLTNHILGVIVCYSPHHQHPPFAEASFFHELTIAGKRLPIDIVVFDPKEINWSNRSVTAWYIDDQKKWKKSLFSLPKVIYDRCYYQNGRHYMEYKASIAQLNTDSQIRFLGRALGGKAQTYDILKKYPEIHPYLPLTLRYQDIHDIFEFIAEHRAALLKPNGGSHGRGIIAIQKREDYYQIQGRSKSNQPFYHLVKNEDKLKLWLKKMIGDTRYIIQSFLELTTIDNHPFDIRILVQKNEKREWETTGLAARIGNSDTITSNLHGGGHATRVQPFLEENYPKNIIPIIMKQIQQISSTVPPLIEENHGSLLELGLDIGIDRKGSVWLLEANSKPGRSIFTQTGENEIRQRSIQLPVSYAYALLESS